MERRIDNQWMERGACNIGRQVHVAERGGLCGVEGRQVHGARSGGVKDVEGRQVHGAEWYEVVHSRWKKKHVPGTVWRWASGVERRVGSGKRHMWLTMLIQGKIGEEGVRERKEEVNLQIWSKIEEMNVPFFKGRRRV